MVWLGLGRDGFFWHPAKATASPRNVTAKSLVGLVMNWEFSVKQVIY
jgi:hypothetical protein